MTSNTQTTQALLARLQKLEAAGAARNALGRYVALCDQPCDDRAFPQLGDLFTEDAVWEGVGQHYAATFGRQSGRAAIVAFLGGYLAPSPHFERNLHFLTSEQIEVSDDGAWARGSWLMLQVSRYGHGRGGAEAITARLEIDFSPASDGRWLISHFRTRRLDCAPWPVLAGGLAP